MGIQTEVMELPPIGTNCVVLRSAVAPEVAVVDAPLNAWMSIEKRIVQEGLKVVALLLTHGHWDHTLDGWLFQKQGISLYGHRGDQPFFENPGQMASFALPGLEMKGFTVDHWLEAGQSFQLLGERVEIRHVPGHSPGSVLFWFRDSGFAVSGDAIFRGSVGRTDFPGCSFAELENSIRGQIYTLPEETRLIPGHGPETDVATEKQTNSFVKGS